MGNKTRVFKLNNEGMTLLELIIAMAISSIVIGIVIGFTDKENLMANYVSDFIVSGEVIDGNRLDVTITAQFKLNDKVMSSTKQLTLRNSRKPFDN